MVEERRLLRISGDREGSLSAVSSYMDVVDRGMWGRFGCRNMEDKRGSCGG
jgi:hypothetical protein